MDWLPLTVFGIAGILVLWVVKILVEALIGPTQDRGSKRPRRYN